MIINCLKASNIAVSTDIINSQLTNPFPIRRAASAGECFAKDQFFGQSTSQVDTNLNKQPLSVGVNLVGEGKPSGVAVRNLALKL